MRTHRRMQRAAAAALAAATLLTAVACGSRNPEPGESIPPEAPVTQAPAKPTLPEPQAGTDRNDPLALIVTMCETVFTRDAGTEKGYSDSYRRAKPLMTAALVGELLKPATVERPFPQWVRWQNEKAWIQGDCAVTSSEHPEDTATSVARVLSVTEVAHPADDPDSTTTTRDWVVYATASKGGSGWQVSQFRVQTT
ncbi:hypothetical protein [Gordonia sihwensis]|uniref:hypothetical protein n=1 Tax=Gordonia sihwensis TaxID=173559 RepID=UPI0012DFF939|nr:hypothetical protein [Gordonia sihwensis]